MGRGRKKDPNSMDTILKIRIHSSEKKELMERLDMEGMNLADYIRALLALDKKEGYICKY